MFIKEIEPVKRTDLIEGEIYLDNNRKDAVIFRFVKKENNTIFFKIIFGSDKIYNANKDGLIFFSLHWDLPFYKFK